MHQVDFRTKRVTSTNTSDKQTISKKPRKDPDTETDLCICLDCGSKISRGWDYNKKGHRAPKHSDKPNDNYSKHIAKKTWTCKEIIEL